MKHTKIYLLIAFLFATFISFGQRTTSTDNLKAKTSVTVGTAPKTNGAILDVNSTTEGALLPRMTQTQRDNLPAVAGMMIYNTSAKTYQYHNGTTWVDFGSGAGTSDYIKADSIELIAGIEAPENSTVFSNIEQTRYKVQPNPVSGYATDSVAVHPVTGGYAVIQSEKGSYNVDWFGAVGDGTTDDREAIVKAISFASINNESVHFSGGKTYHISTPASNGTNIGGLKVLDGQGAKITFDAVTSITTILAIQSDSNVVMRNLSFVGDTTENYPVATLDSLLRTSNVRPIYINSSKNITIENCSFFGCVEGVKFSKDIVTDSLNKNITLKNLLFEQCVQSMSVFKCTNVVVDNVRSYRDGMVSGAGQKHHFYGQNCTNVTISNSHFRGGSGGYAMNVSYDGSDPNPSSNYKVSNTYFESCPPPAFVNTTDIQFNNCSYYDVLEVMRAYGNKRINFNNIIIENESLNTIDLFVAGNANSDIQFNNVQSNGAIRIDLAFTDNIKVRNSIFTDPIKKDGSLTVVRQGGGSFSGTATFDNVSFIQDSLTANATEFVSMQNVTDSRVIFNGCTFENNSLYDIPQITRGTGSTIEEFNNCRTNMSTWVLSSAQPAQARLNNCLDENGASHTEYYKQVSGNITLKYQGVIEMSTENTITVDSTNEYFGRVFRVIPATKCSVTSNNGKTFDELTTISVKGATDFIYNGTNFVSSTAKTTLEEFGTYNHKAGVNNFNSWTSGTYNTGIGDSNFKLLSTSSYNTGFGFYNFENNNGNYNTGAGRYNFRNNTSGSYNAGFGNQNFNSNTGSFNFGSGSQNGLSATGSHNNLTGEQNLYSATSLNAVTANGQQNGYNIGTLNYSNLHGYRNAYTATTASYIDLTGKNTFLTATSISNSFASGNDVGRYATDLSVTDVFAWGDNALAYSTKMDNIIAIGSHAGDNNTFTNIAVLGRYVEADADNQFAISTQYSTAKLGTLKLDTDQAIGATEDEYIMTYDDGTGLTSLVDWVLEGSSSPAGLVTPDRIGQMYIDTTNDIGYLAVGLTNSDWKQITN